MRSDLTILAVVGVLLLAAFAAGASALYRAVYSPSAFVERYLGMLADGRAADALQLPGVGIDGASLVAAGVPAPISDALLREAALAELSDVEILSEESADGVWMVTASYTAGGQAGQTTFAIERDGWNGIVPRWRFATPPLSVIQLVVRGANAFTVNGFTIDRRQIAGVDSDPLDPISLLAFVPGRYAVGVDTPISHSTGVRVLTERTLEVRPVDLQTTPTDEFRGVVQTRVTEFLESCATQQVLLPTGCPFGFQVQHRLASLPEWSIRQHPQVSLVPDGANWRIQPSDALAHIAVDVQSIFDGSIHALSEDVPFQVAGTVTLLADGSVSIRVGVP